MAIRNSALALIAIAFVAGCITLGGIFGQQPNAATNSDSAATMERLGSRQVAAHDPSTIVKCKDEYWLFYTGRGVPSYRSKDLVTWQAGPRVFEDAPAWVAKTVPQNRSGLYYWAPDVIRVSERYLLYYSVSSFGKNTSAIGLATNATLDPADPSFHWTDQGIVVQSADSNDFNAIDPCLTLDASGKLWMAYGSYWSGIKLIELDRASGKRVAPDSPVHALAHSSSIEAAFIHRHGRHYYLFVNWGVCCRGVDSTYNIRVGRSEKITGPYVDRSGKDLLAGGGSLLLESEGQFVGPGHAGIVAEGGREWLSCHFYDGTRRGRATLALRPLSWNKDGWPSVSADQPRESQKSE